MLEVTIDTLKGIVAECDEIDAELQSTIAGGSRATIKNKIVRENEDDISPLITYFGSLETTEQKMAQFSRLSTEFDKTFKAEIDAMIDALVAALPKPNTSTISGDERTTKIEYRKSLADKFKALKAVWPFMHPGEDISSIQEPGKLNYLRGPKGPKVLDSYDFFVDGKEIPASLTKLAKTLPVKADGSMHTALDIRNICVTAYQAEDSENPFDWKNPPASFTFHLPGGSVFAAKKKSEDVEDDDDDEVVAETVVIG
jgi:hypothetical protein